MAHASTTDAAKIHDKKMRKVKANERAKWNALSEEEKNKILEKRNARCIKQEVAIAIWDFKNKQYPGSKYHILRKTLRERLDEIDKAGINLQCTKEIREIKEVLEKIGE
jgi:hypothetical protein